MPFSSIINLSEDRDQIADLGNHAAHSGGVFELAHTIELAQTHDTTRGAMRLFGTDPAANQLDLDRLLRCHNDFSVQTKRSSTDLPRLAATSAGVVEFFKASKVARTML